jgi:hypothetical protein
MALSDGVNGVLILLFHLRLTCGSQGGMLYRSMHGGAFFVREKERPVASACAARMRGQRREAGLRAYDQLGREDGKEGEKG